MNTASYAFSRRSRFTYVQFFQEENLMTILYIDICSQFYSKKKHFIRIFLDEMFKKSLKCKN